MTAPPPPRVQPRSIRTIGITAKARLPEAASVVGDIVRWLKTRGLETVVEARTAARIGHSDTQVCSAAELPTRSDLLLVLGGDGTVLGVARDVADSDADVPILAINFGSLGFLTEVTLPELYGSLQSAIDGTARIDQRQMLHATVQREDKTLTDRVVLNDVVIGKSALSNILELAVTVGNQFMTNFQADGLIIASPTGSTAYSMAAGGPIVHPLLEALVLTPIAPHTLTNRPIVLPSTAEVHVRPVLNVSHRSAYVSFDGQSGFELLDGDLVTVTGSPRPLQVVRAEARNYFSVLREKLKWGGR